MCLYSTNEIFDVNLIQYVLHVLQGSEKLYMLFK